MDNFLHCVLSKCRYLIRRKFLEVSLVNIFIIKQFVFCSNKPKKFKVTNQDLLNFIISIYRFNINEIERGHSVYCIVLGCLLIYFIRYYSCFSVVVDLLTQLLILDFRVYYTPIVSRAHKFAVLLLIIARAHCKLSI